MSSPSSGYLFGFVVNIISGRWEAYLFYSNNPNVDKPVNFVAARSYLMLKFCGHWSKFCTRTMVRFAEKGNILYFNVIMDSNLPEFIWLIVVSRTRSIICPTHCLLNE